MHLNRTQRLLPYQAALEVEGDHDAGQAGSVASRCQPPGSHAELHLELEPGRAFPADRSYSKATRRSTKPRQLTSNLAVAAAVATAITTADASIQSLYADSSSTEVAYAELEHDDSVVDLSRGCQQRGRCPLSAVDELSILHATNLTAKPRHDVNEALAAHASKSTRKYRQENIDS